MQLRELLGHIESEFPAETAMEGDAIGLQLQSGRKDITSVCVTLEITDESTDEAIRRGADCIVTFHPFIYQPLRTITDRDRTGRLATRLIKADVAVIAIHTNFDAHPRGTNAQFANRLGLENTRPLIADSRREGYGMGISGNLSVALEAEELAGKVGGICGAPVIFTSARSAKTVSSVAIVCGSGFSFLRNAIESGVDAFITADVKYHGFHAACEHLTLISPGHYEMEQFVPQALGQELRNLTGDSIHVFEAQTITNPVRYAPLPMNGANT